jgi:nucleotide-binding universal stress UspA family protein
LKKLNWDDGDLLVVASSRFAAPRRAAPRRIFLGSTAARILAGVDVPVIVVPRDG